MPSSRGVGPACMTMLADWFRSVSVRSLLLTRSTIANIIAMVVRRRRKRSPRQGSLDFDAGRHGGRRENSGRPKGPNPKLWHRRREPFAASHPLHVTVPVRWDVPSLRGYRILRALEATFRRACSRKDFRLVHYSIQDSHVHLIVEADGAAALGRGMKSIASRIAYAVNRALKRGRRGKVLRDRYHHAVLTCPRSGRINRCGS